MVEVQVFQNSSFCLKSQMLSFSTRYCSCVHWSDRLTLSSFKKMPATYPCLNSHSLSVNHYVKKNGVPWTKQLVELTTQSHKCLSLGQPLYFSMQQKCFICASCFVAQNTRKPCTQAGRLNTFSASSRTSLSVWCWKYIMITSAVWCHCFD